MSRVFFCVLLAGCWPNDPGYDPFLDTGLWTPSQWSAATTPTTGGGWTGTAGTSVTGGGTNTGVTTSTSTFVGPTTSTSTTSTTTNPGGPGTTSTYVYPYPLVAAETVLIRETVCANPSLRDSLGPFEVLSLPSPPETEINRIGSGVVVMDLDGDQLDDIYFAGSDGGTFYQALRDGGFEDATASVLGPFDLTNATGGAAADFDADGDLDLFVTRYDEPNVLLRNDGGVFVDGSADAGISTSADKSVSVVFADIDGNLWLDILVANSGDAFGVDPSRLYFQISPGRFEDVSDIFLDELAKDVWSSSVSAFDFMHKGVPDIFLWSENLDSGPPSMLLLNMGTSFYSIPGIVNEANRIHSAVPADFTYDGLLDWVQVGPRHVGIYPGSVVGDYGELAWTSNIAGHLGLSPDEGAGGANQITPWATVVEDFNHDLNLDVAVTYGWADVDGPEEDMEDGFFVRTSAETFVDMASDYGFAHPGPSRGLVAGDFNLDGWQDLARRNLDGDNQVFLSRCGLEGYVRIMIDQAIPNMRGVGAQVNVFAYGVMQSRWIKAGGALGSSEKSEIHVGLGEVPGADFVDVLWTDGTMSRVAPVNANTTLMIIKQ
jgi:hypothetical protein